MLVSYTQASGHNNMKAKILDPVYSQIVAESTGTGALLRQKLALKSEITKVGSDERPWLVAAVEEGYQGVAQGVLELVEELYNDIKNKLTCVVLDALVQNMLISGHILNTAVAQNAQYDYIHMLIVSTQSDFAYV
jgi:hypothetical protein